MQNGGTFHPDKDIEISREKPCFQSIFCESWICCFKASLSA